MQCCLNNKTALVLQRGRRVKETTKHDSQYPCHINASMFFFKFYLRTHASTMKDFILDLCKFFFLRSPQPSASSSTRHKVNLNIQSASAFAFCVVGSINRRCGSAAGRGAHAREGREEAGGGRVASGSGRGSRG